MDRGRAPAAPQPRPRPLGSHNLPHQAAPAAENPGTWGGNHGHGTGRPGGGDTPPGLWLEAFTQAVNGVPKEPRSGEDSDDAWDKGDQK